MCSVIFFKTCTNWQDLLVLLRSHFTVSEKEVLEFLLFPPSIIQWLESGTIKQVALQPLREQCGILSSNSGCEKVLTITFLPPDKGRKMKEDFFFVAANILKWKYGAG